MLMCVAFYLSHVIIANIISTIIIVYTMKTVKHKLKPLTPEQEIQFLALARAYQFEKNYWSDQLLKRRERSGEAINLKNLYTYQQIRNSNKLTKNNYYSRYNLPVRYCTIALKEAYDLHIRTYEAQISFLKRDLNNRIYKFKLNENVNLNGENTNLDNSHSSNFVNTTSNEATLNIFKDFLYFATNSLFYNYKTFRTFEEEFYSKKFRKARIYQRIQPILKKLFSKASVADVFKLNQVEEINTDQISLLEENIEILNQFLHGNAEAKAEIEMDTPQSAMQLCLEKLLHYYCNCLVKAIVKFRNYKTIQSQINPTITLDGSCYKLYSQYDDECKINRWFLDIMSMEVGKRIKELELTGFHHAKKIMKHKKYANLVLSFDPIDMSYYAHFTFPSRKARKASNVRKARKNNSIHKTKNKTSERNSAKLLRGEAKLIQYKLVSKQSQSNKVSYTTTNLGVATSASLLMTMLTVGGDFGLTENYTFSDGWVSGRKQGKILHYISNSTKNSVAGLQRISEKGFFGVEKNNQTGKRNHKNNCFTHNQLLDNINENYRKKQRKYNSFLQNYKYLLVNEIIEHFTTDSVYGQYSNVTHESHAPVKLVFESLDYTSLGFDKKQKRQSNLIKGILNVLEERIECYNLPIKIEYVHPGYTSQNCPNCYWVARTNRNKAESSFRCQHCGFTAIDDERYQGLTKVVSRLELPSEDDFIASRNIAERLSTIPDSTRLRLRDIKDQLMYMHGKVKVSCKMFDSSNIEC